MKRFCTFALLLSFLFSSNLWAAKNSSSFFNRKCFRTTTAVALTAAAAVFWSGSMILDGHVNHVTEISPMAGACPMGYTMEDLASDGSPHLLRHLRPMSDGETITESSLKSWGLGAGLSESYVEKQLLPTVWISGLMSDGNMEGVVDISKANRLEHEPYRTGFYAKDGVGNLELWEKVADYVYPSSDSDILRMEELIQKLIDFGVERGTTPETVLMGLINGMGKIESANRGEFEMLVKTFGFKLGGEWYLSRDAFMKFPEYDLLSLERMTSYLIPEEPISNGQTKLISGSVLCGEEGFALELFSNHAVSVSDVSELGGVQVNLAKGKTIKIMCEVPVEVFEASLFHVRLEVQKDLITGSPIFIATEVDIVERDSFEEKLEANPMVRSVLKKSELRTPNS